MSGQVSDIIELVRKLSLIEQWQVVQYMLKQLQEETIANKLEELSQKADILDNFSQLQMERLAKAIEESESGKTISHEQVQAEVKKWLTK